MHFAHCTGCDVKIFADKAVADSAVEEPQNLPISMFRNFSKPEVFSRCQKVITYYNLDLELCQEVIRMENAFSSKSDFSTHTQIYIYVLSVVTKDLQLFTSHSVSHSNQETPWLSKDAKRIVLPISLQHLYRYIFLFQQMTIEIF